MADKKTTTTIRDLQTFIDAVEFASDQEEWVPSARQWKRIRDMINSLEETKVEVRPAEPVRYNQPTSFAMPPMPTQPSGLNVPMPTGPHNPLLASNPHGPVRTPDIDTGHGKPYQSSFAS